MDKIAEKIKTLKSLISQAKQEESMGSEDLAKIEESIKEISKNLPEETPQDTEKVPVELPTETPKVEDKIMDDVILGDGFSLKYSKELGLFELFDRDNATSIFIRPIIEEKSEAEKISEYREKLKLDNKNPAIETKPQSTGGEEMLELTYVPGESLESSELVACADGVKESVKASMFISKEQGEKIIASKGEGDISPEDFIYELKKNVKSMEDFKAWKNKLSAEQKPEVKAFDISFEEGDTLEESKFVAKEGKEISQVSASQVIPLYVQKKIINGDSDVCPPEDIIEQMKKTISSIKEFNSWAEKRKMIVSAQIKASKRTATNNKINRKSAFEGFSLRQEEVETVPAKVEEKVEAISPSESKADSGEVTKPVSRPSKVRDYYGRLPSSGPGSESQALSPKEAAVIRAQKRRIAELESQLKLKEEEIENAKKELETKERVAAEASKKLAQTEKTQKIYRVISELKSRNLLDSSKEDDMIRKLNAMSNDQIDSMLTVSNMFSVPTVSVETRETEEKGNLPHLTAEIRSQKTDSVEEKLRNIWNK